MGSRLPSDPFHAFITYFLAAGCLAQLVPFFPALHPQQHWLCKSFGRSLGLRLWHKPQKLSPGESTARVPRDPKEENRLLKTLGGFEGRARSTGRSQQRGGQGV